ncbi:14409_t:CDS:2, partial [Gigaspora margarita]
LPEPSTTVQSTRSEYGSYINDHAGRQFIAAIARVIEEATLNELQTSKAWSLIIDESNTISNKKNLAIVSRHILHNLLIFHYLGIVKLQSASSKAILDELNRFILAKHLLLETLYHLEVMHPFLTEHHCISHCLALASKDAAEQTPYFETYNETLSLSNVVNNLYQIINFVISTLLENASKGQKTAQQLHNISEVTMQVNAIIESITTDFIGTTNVQPIFGTILLCFMKQNNILSNNLLLFIQEFAINTVTNIKLRFSDHKIINSFRIFDPKQLPTDHYSISVYGNAEIIKIGNFYRTSKKIADSNEHYKVIDADNFAQEWRVIHLLLSNY